MEQEFLQLNIPPVVNRVKADYIDNPIVHNGYNMSYEPYASKYDNKGAVGDHR